MTLECKIRLGECVGGLAWHLVETGNCEGLIGRAEALCLTDTGALTTLGPAPGISYYVIYYPSLA